MKQWLIMICIIIHVITLYIIVMMVFKRKCVILFSLKYSYKMVNYLSLRLIHLAILFILELHHVIKVVIVWIMLLLYAQQVDIVVNIHVVLLHVQVHVELVIIVQKDLLFLFRINVVQLINTVLLDLENQYQLMKVIIQHQLQQIKNDVLDKQFVLKVIIVLVVYSIFVQQEHMVI